jgi:hypothetical protein
MGKRISEMDDVELMGGSSSRRIKHLRKRIRVATSEASRKSAEASLKRISKLTAKLKRSVRNAEVNIIARYRQRAYARAEHQRLKEVNAALRAGMRQEKLREKYFTNRTSFKHAICSMVDARPGHIYRYHLGMCSFIHLTKALLRLGAPLEGDFRRAIPQARLSSFSARKLENDSDSRH